MLSRNVTTEVIVNVIVILGSVVRIITAIDSQRQPQQPAAVPAKAKHYELRRLPPVTDERNWQ